MIKLRLVMVHSGYKIQVKRSFFSGWVDRYPYDEDLCFFTNNREQALETFNRVSCLILEELKDEVYRSNKEYLRKKNRKILKICKTVRHRII